MTQSTWSDAEKERLTALWASGLSCGKIGEAMRRSKNAVVSAIHRLELPPRPSPIRFGNPALTIEERREHAAASQRKANLRRRNLTLPPLPSKAVAPVDAIARPVASVRPPPFRVPPTTHRFTFAPSQPRPERIAMGAYAGIVTCQFPRQVGTEFGGVTWLFCGAPATRGAYCDTCGDRCYLGRRKAVVEAVAA